MVAGGAFWCCAEPHCESSRGIITCSDGTCPSELCSLCTLLSPPLVPPVDNKIVDYC